MSEPKLKASAHSVSVIRSMDLKKVRWREIQSLLTPRMVFLIFLMTLTIVAWVTLHYLSAMFHGTSKLLKIMPQAPLRHEYDRTTTWER